MDIGTLCETVIKKREPLLVANALEDDEWKLAPEIKVGMVSYLGFPVVWPDGRMFGTICVLDDRANRYNDQQFLLHCRDVLTGTCRRWFAWATNSIASRRSVSYPLSVGELQMSQVIVRTELAADLQHVTADRVQLQQVVRPSNHRRSHFLFPVGPIPPSNSRQARMHAVPSESGH
jgi:GAF domain-containing protein